MNCEARVPRGKTDVERWKILSIAGKLQAPTLCKNRKGWGTPTVGEFEFSVERVGHPPYSILANDNGND